MDGMHREGRYADLLKRLNKLKQTSDVTDKPLIVAELSEILDQLRNKGERSNARMHYFLLYTPLLVTIIWYTVSDHQYLLSSLILVCIAVFELCRRKKMTDVIQSSQRLQKASSYDEDTSFATAKVVYIESALTIKKTRLLFVSIAYMLFFPMLCVLLHRVLLGSDAFDHMWMSIFVSYTVGGVLWYLYFDRSFDDYDQIEEALGDIISQIEYLY